ncbi:MAG: glycosyltransferase, partial [Opitutae bacterium]
MSKVAFLYATFPRPTETFVRRELRQLSKLGLVPELFSLWRGSKKWNGLKVNLFPLIGITSLVFWIPYWAWKKPEVFKLILGHLWGSSCPGLQNWNETFLGLAFALARAKSFQAENYSRLHAVWATMPATAALGIHKLVDLPFSMGAHAYDVFRHRGDWLLPLKLRYARTVRTSSQSTAHRLSLLGAQTKQLVLIYRSIEKISLRENFQPVQAGKLALLSIGRLVEKKGYFLLLHILQRLKNKKIPFQLTIIGGGRLESEIRRKTKLLGLKKEVIMLGHVDESKIDEFYLSSDALLFTGIISSNGDRDGIPNVIAEAMSHGLLVLASNRAGSSEAFVDQESGFSLDPYNS